MRDKPCIPNGILLNLCKHIDAAKLNSDELKSNYVHLMANVCYGNFDRLRFYPIENFTDFRNQSCNGHLWTGGRRDIMLFSLSKEKNDRSFRFICNNSFQNPCSEDNPYQDVLPWEIKMFSGNEPANRKFLSVSMLYLSDKIKNLGMPYEKLISYCKNAIAEIVNVVNADRIKNGHQDDTIIFEVFGSLNSAELTILWGSNQYVDVQYLVDQFRYMQLKKKRNNHRVFYSSYTIVAIYQNACELTDVRGGAMIQFSTTTRINGLDSSRNKALRYIGRETKKLDPSSSKIVGIYSCAGEYDYIYKGSSPVLESMFRSDINAFDDCNPSYQKHFSSTTTRLYYLEEDVRELADLLKDQLSSMLFIGTNDSDFDPAMAREKYGWGSLPQVFRGTKKDGVRTKYLQYTKALRQLFAGNSSTSPHYCGLSGSNFLYNLDLLFCDYVQCVSTMPNLQWAKDFEFQFSSALTVLLSTMPVFEELASSDANPYSEFELDTYITQGHEIISVLQDNIHHMAEAGKLFFEEPSSHSESTGQYDLIIHTYYGIIKNVLLEIAKNSQFLKETPTPLVPILRFSGHPIIKSKLFVDEKNIKPKIVEIDIPYDACGEIGLYSPLLIHELYHYVPPVDRKARNQAFAVILLTELTVDLLQTIAWEINEDSDTNSTIILQICHKFRELLIPLLDNDKDALYNHVHRCFSKSDNWNAFSEDLLLWIKGYDEKGNTSLLFQGYFSLLLTKVYEGLKEWCKNSPDDDRIKIMVERLSVVIAPSPNTKTDEYYLHATVFEGYNDWNEPIAVDGCTNTIIGKLSSSIVTNTNTSLLYRLSCCSDAIFDDITQALRELLPDYAMVHFTKMQDLSDYLLLLSIVIDKQYSRVCDASNQGFLQFRIGFIADYLLYRFIGDLSTLESELDKLETAFCKKYNAYRCLGLRDSGADQSKVYDAEARKWFAFFKNRLSDHKEIYLLYRSLLSRLANNQFAAGMKAAPEKGWSSLKAPFSALIESKDNHFQAELDIIRTFQPQWFLEDLQFRKPPAPVASSIILGPSVDRCGQKKRLVFTVDRGVEAAVAINAATEVLQEYHRRVFGRQSNPRLWFRGCKSSSYPILPSIMGRFLERDKTCPNGKNYIGSLVEYQRALLDEFRCRADGAREFINASSYTTADYIALMQHYSQQTCYLDWSDDAYSSLYFALEYEIAQAQAIIKKKSPDQEALEPVLFLFDPKLYNLARLRLLNRFSTKIKEQFQLDSDPAKPNCTADRDLQAIFETVAKDLAEAEQIEKDLQNKCLTDINVPNISVRSTAKRYGIHSLNLIQNNGIKDCALRDPNIKTKEDLKAATFTKYKCFVGDLWNLPLAVYTSRLNPRIRSQSGNFLAYSVFSRPVCCENEKTLSRALCEYDEKKLRKTDYFKYLSLKDIQAFYMEVFEKDPNPGVPFLLEVIIPSGEKKQLAEYLYHAGFNKYRIYPELDNLSLS